jgi:hypothetical protein
VMMDFDVFFFLRGISYPARNSNGVYPVARAKEGSMVQAWMCGLSLIQDSRLSKIGGRFHREGLPWIT